MFGEVWATEAVGARGVSYVAEARSYYWVGLDFESPMPYDPVFPTGTARMTTFALVEGLYTSVPTGVANGHDVQFENNLQFREVATLSFAMIDRLYADGEQTNYGTWAIAILSASPVMDVMVYYQALNYWMRGHMYAGRGIKTPPISIAIGAVLPWDAEAAPEYGMSSRASDAAPVLWVVNPIQALAQTFTPTVPVTSRIDSLVGVVSSKFPFSLAASITFGNVGSAPIDLPSVQFAGLVIAPNNLWINSLGAVLRAVVTVLAIISVASWLRGKMTPKAVI